MNYKVVSGNFSKTVTAENHHQAAVQICKIWGDNCEKKRLGLTILCKDGEDGEDETHFSTQTILNELGITHHCNHDITCEKCKGVKFNCFPTG